MWGDEKVEEKLTLVSYEKDRLERYDLRFSQRRGQYYFSVVIYRDQRNIKVGEMCPPAGTATSKASTCRICSHKGQLLGEKM